MKLSNKKNYAHFCKPSRVDNFEDTSVTTFPCNIIAVALLMIVEQLLEEIPKQTTVFKFN